jgi:hypothetical protein
VNRLVRSLVCLIALSMSACATTRAVQPWEKRALAKPAMRIERSRLESHYAYQLYASREGSNGGDAVGRGGCGCN